LESATDGGTAKGPCRSEHPEERLMRREACSRSIASK
jgi:hypothetical protein